MILFCRKNLLLKEFISPTDVSDLSKITLNFNVFVLINFSWNMLDLCEEKYMVEGDFEGH